ncbi:MAG: 50S ribosomal protein L17 [Candidatus Eisenbacteria bacterium]
MRHRNDHRKLSRTASHRKALLRNQVTSLFTHGRIETTVAKAKESRRLAERLISYAKRADVKVGTLTDEKEKDAVRVAARRRAARFIHGRDIVTKLFDDIAPHMMEREGGYTRIIKTRIRKGDAGEMAILELVKSESQIKAERAARKAAEEAAQQKSSVFRRRKKKEAEPAEAAEGEATE